MSRRQHDKIMHMGASAIAFPPDWARAGGLWPIDLENDSTLRQSYDVLRGKWGETPFRGLERCRSVELLRLSDPEILAAWTDTFVSSSTGPAYSVRGWYQTLYGDALRGKKVLDFGCGLAADCVMWAERFGAQVTFVDIVETNVRFVERVCRLKSIDANFCVLEDLRSLERLPTDFDFIYCCGSFHHAPLEMAKTEAQALLRHLPPGGRWIQLAYPKSRWEREGRMRPDEWGSKTDGENTPWVDWHDLAKVTYFLAPAQFDVVLTLEFHDSDFNWFDLIRRK